MRMMTNKFRGKTFYESTFNEETGALVRIIDVNPRNKDGYYSYPEFLVKSADQSNNGPATEEWRKLYPQRRSAFSPSPETIDISITDWCDFGCEYCYQDSTVKQKAAKAGLVEQVIKSFDHTPYQVAIGGGEPTSHPAFHEILASARKLGTVPNYTTAGHIWRPEVIEATNKYCGGVSLTFHAWKGWDWFEATYRKWKKALKVQLNVHLIADKDVTENLSYLIEMQKVVGPINLVLLAYYPDVGRSSLQGIMPNHVYQHSLPLFLKKALDKKMKIAFSEGLLAYFFSRPSIGIDTRYASKSEGLFSCYVDPRGRMSASSFDPPSKGHELIRLDKKDKLTVWDEPLQKQWSEGFHRIEYQRIGDACGDCYYKQRCSVPDFNHYLICDFAQNNSGPARQPKYPKMMEDDL